MKPDRNLHIVTMSQFGRDISKAIRAMTYTEKAAFRFAVCLRTPGLRERILN